MRRLEVVSFCTLFWLSSASLAEKAPCPAREAGQAYPWQNLQPMRGDQHALIFIDVDRTGRPLRCAMGKNNIPDSETRFRVCQAFTGDWRAPPAREGDPSVRTIERRFTMIGYEHQMANQKARKRWFKEHPEERPECYPE